MQPRNKGLPNRRISGNKTFVEQPRMTLAQFPSAKLIMLCLEQSISLPLARLLETSQSSAHNACQVAEREFTAYCGGVLPPSSHAGRKKIEEELMLQTKWYISIRIRHTTIQSAKAKLNERKIGIKFLSNSYLRLATIGQLETAVTWIQYGYST